MKPLGVLIAGLLCMGVGARAGAADQLRVEEAPITDLDRDHWSFEPLVRPPLPAVKRIDWVRNPIDRFVLARLEQASLAPLPQADRVSLMRRLPLDLCGLPPTPEQVDRFVKDPSPHACEELVDRLLASPSHGQRWGQHWLDLARFAETDGFELDHVRPQAWRYRDWVIRALNADLPYDRFLQMQLAGDELFPRDPDAGIATAFCLSGPDMPDINSQEERRHSLLNELTSTVGSALLGLQIGCAECHDHKYDPISQADFYRLRAVFEPAVHVQRNVSVTTLSESETLPAKSFVMVRGDYRHKGAPIQPGFPRIANPWEDVIPVPHPSTADDRRSALARWITRPDHPLTARVIVNRVWQHHFGRGLSASSSDFGVMGDLPTHPQLLDWLATELVRSGWSLKGLHRLIVTSATYRQASRVSTPGWSAETRRQARQDWTRAAQADPRNELLSRFPRRRLDGETIRDVMLAAAGQLNLEAGGPGVMPPLPTELRETLLANQWKVDGDASQHVRRSIYVFARRNLRYPVFDAFDRPDANASCARRVQSTTANQSLLMLNSATSLEMARRLAGVSLKAAEGDLDTAIQVAFRRALVRWPTDQEQALLASFLEEHAGALRDERGSEEQLATPLPAYPGMDRFAAAALSDVCLALLNSSEFVYVD